MKKLILLIASIVFIPIVTQAQVNLGLEYGRTVPIQNLKSDAPFYGVNLLLNQDHKVKSSVGVNYVGSDESYFRIPLTIRLPLNFSEFIIGATPNLSNDFEGFALLSFSSGLMYSYERVSFKTFFEIFPQREYTYLDSVNFSVSIKI